MPHTPAAGFELVPHRRVHSRDDRKHFGEGAGAHRTLQARRERLLGRVERAPQQPFLLAHVSPLPTDEQPDP